MKDKTGYMETNERNLRRILAANVKEQRKILGLSQEKLAEQAGLSWQTINSIECRRTWVSDGTLEALAKVFNIESFHLLMPPEARAVITLSPSEALQRLCKAKRTFDDSFSEILNSML